MDKKKLMASTSETILSSMKLKKTEITLDGKTLEKYPLTLAAIGREFRPVMLEELKNQQDANRDLIVEMENNEAELILPLGQPNRIDGLMILGDKKNNELFSEDDLRLLSMLARALTVALLNAAQYTQAQDHISELDVIRRLGEIISSSIELNELAEKILALYREVGATPGRAFLLLFADLPANVYICCNEHSKEKFELKIEDFAACLAKDDLQEFPKVPKNEFSAHYKLKPFVCIPLKVDGKVLGLVLVETEGKKLDQASMGILTPQIEAAFGNAVAYEKIKQSKLHSENILQSMSSGVVTIDQDKRITSINTKAEEILGLKAGEVIGKPYPEVWEMIKGDLIETTLSLGTSHTNKEAALNIAGRKALVRMSTEQVKDGEGKPVGVMISITDLAQVKELEAKLKHADMNFDFLAQMSKMALEVSHKINNPLQIINNYLTLMGIQLKGAKNIDAPAKEFLDEGINALQTEAKRISATISELKKSAGPIELNLGELDLNAICAETLEKTKEVYEKRGLEVKDYFNALPKIVADRDLLRQALFEVLTQVGEDCSASQPVLIATRKDKGGVQIEITYPTNTLMFYQKEKLSKEISATSFAARVGTLGYGLRDAEGIISAHGGRKEMIVSKLGKSENEWQVKIFITLPKKPASWTAQPLATMLSNLAKPASAQSILEKAHFPILIIDDELRYPILLQQILKDEGYTDTAIVHSGEEAVKHIKLKPVSLAIVDIRMGGMDGLETMGYLKNINPEIELIVISATAIEGTDYPMQAGKLGVRKFFAKPFNYMELLKELENIFNEKQKGQGEVLIKPQLKYFIGQSPAMKQIYNKIKLSADNDSPVLILGESGTGKELIATAIHEHSKRKSKPFIAVNCSALPSGLVESELFGYVKGAFTGANSDKKGKFEEANGGTIFLDEICTLPPEVQVKLLRVLQPEADGKRRITRLGSNTAVEIDVRIISATNENISQALKEKRLREDFVHRIMVIAIEAPALSERGEDVWLLAQYYLEQYNKTHKKNKIFAPEMAKVFMSYSWPGNVRELQHTIERLVVISPQEIIRPLDFASEKSVNVTSEEIDYNLNHALDHMEMELIEKALAICGGNQSQAAEKLGIPESTLRNKMKKLKIVF
ncbi:MAG: sigma 54-interacting transcriptional regulator [Candidatus Margulisiibacteriota bacterium]